VRRYANGELTKALLLEERLRYRTTYPSCDRLFFIKVILPESGILPENAIATS
jgi:hypothetical protein